MSISTIDLEVTVAEEKGKFDNHDGQVLAALGYEQEFKREFSLWSTFSVGFSILGTLPSFASTMTYSVGYAGTAGLLWAWPIAMIFIQLVALSMAELCSAMPTSGGLYYASAVLAPPEWGPFAAWVTGWSNWIGQIAGAPSCDYALAAMLLAAVSIENPDYVPQDWHVFLLTVVILSIHIALNCFKTRFLAKMNSLGSAFNIIALLSTMVLILVTDHSSPKFNATKDVWPNIENGTDFPDGIAIIISFTSVLWAMNGYDSPFHLSEECSNADVASPRAIVLTSTIGGILGWLLQIVVAYTIKDIDAVMDSSSGQPWAAYLFQILPRRVALAILAFTLVCSWSMGQAALLCASRVTYAYSRDDCLPGSSIWKKVDKTTRTPVNSVLFVGGIGIVMCFLILAGSTAVNALFQVTALAQFMAFIIPIGIRATTAKTTFRHGPRHLGPFGRPCGIAACLFVVIMVPFLCLPATTGRNLPPDEMNWTCLVYGAPMLAILVWWKVDAHQWFHGPNIDIRHNLQQY